MTDTVQIFASASDVSQNVFDNKNVKTPNFDSFYQLALLLTRKDL